MSEVIQSLSICCPSATGKCINHCKTCTARQHTNPYQNKFDGGHYGCFEYWNDVIKRMKYAQSKGCTTVILTGSNEPQQNRRWLEGLYLAMQSLSEPFVNIEIQTTGAFIDMDYLKFLKAIGVTTLAVSTFNIFDDEINRNIEESADKNLSVQTLCDNAFEIGLNIRICVNLTDYALIKDNYISDNDTEIVTNILDRCAELHANQVTFRKMWSNPNTPEHEWIKVNCVIANKVIDVINLIVPQNGKLICKLPYGAARYDYKGFSIVVDTDSMGKDEDNIALKYYIIRENGKMYSSWDSVASLVF